MANPENVPQFLAEVTSQTLGETVSARDALQRCIDDSADTGRTYLTLWGVVHQAGLQATLHFHNTMFRASQTVFDATVHANLPSNRPAPRVERLWPDATLEITARGTRLIPGITPPTSPDSAEQKRADEWAGSALNLQPPLGMIAFGLVDSDDDI